MGRLEALDGGVLAALRASMAKTEEEVSAGRHAESGEIQVKDVPARDLR